MDDSSSDDQRDENAAARSPTGVDEESVQQESKDRAVGFGDAAPSPVQTDVPLIAVAGSVYIQRHLSREGPSAVIRRFQARCALGVPHSEQVLNFLDLLMPRRIVHQSLLHHLKIQLAERVAQATPHQLQQLLEQSFRYISIEELREIPVSLLQRMQDIPLPYRELLAQNVHLLEEMPLAIRRQVWETYASLFQAKILPIVVNFVEQRCIDHWHVNTLFDTDEHISSRLRRREDDPILQEIAEYIGNSGRLYKLVVKTIREQFAYTNQYGYCILRMELLMTLHDKRCSAILESDPCHKFAWCLDAAIREGTIETRLLDELKTLYSHLKDRDKEHEGGAKELSREFRYQLLDLSMVIAHPLVTNVMLRTVVTQLDETIGRSELPKDNDYFRLVVYLLLLGCSATRMLRAKRQSKLPKAPATLFKSWFPLLAELLIIAQLGDEDNMCSLFEPLLCSDKAGVASATLMYVCLSMLRLRDIVRVKQLFPLLGNLEMRSPWSAGALSVMHRFTVSLLAELGSDSMSILLKNDEHLRQVCFLECLRPLASRSTIAHLEILQAITKEKVAKWGMDPSSVAAFLLSLRQLGTTGDCIEGIPGGSGGQFADASEAPDGPVGDQSQVVQQKDDAEDDVNPTRKAYRERISNFIEMEYKRLRELFVGFDGDNDSRRQLDHSPVDIAKSDDKVNDNHTAKMEVDQFNDDQSTTTQRT